MPAAADKTRAAAAARAAALKVVEVRPPLAGFFTKRCTAACGVPVLAHQCVADAALIEAAARVDAALRHLPGVAQRLVSLGTSVQVIGADQLTTDLPQFAHIRAKPEEAAAFNARGRGYGGLCPCCAEESLLKLPSDRFADHRDICTHELAHTILDWGFPPAKAQALKAACEAVRVKSVAAGRWTSAYAASNADEFFAECAMWVMGSRGDAGEITHPPVVPGPHWLAAYDRDASRLMHTVLGGKWKWGGESSDQDADVITDVVPFDADDALSFSPSGDTAPCLLVVVNETDSPLTLTWLDRNGAGKVYLTAPPWCSAGQATYVGHVWKLSAAAAGGQQHDIGVFTACPGTGRVRVTKTRRRRSKRKRTAAKGWSLPWETNDA
jgi:hypothetical protein